MDNVNRAIEAKKNNKKKEEKKNVYNIVHVIKRCFLLVWPLLANT